MAQLPTPNWAGVVYDPSDRYPSLQISPSPPSTFPEKRTPSAVYLRRNGHVSLTSRGIQRPLYPQGRRQNPKRPIICPHLDHGAKERGRFLFLVAAFTIYPRSRASAIVRRHFLPSINTPRCSASSPPITCYKIKINQNSDIIISGLISKANIKY